ncbi:hypothetical protein RUM44_008222 [Polyplax serrata]|uniref:Ectonucleoside triphosphate diphosphohydrolase 5 n=1 Tax=Polyplax serrata TaxID=468196 RepID=A0ABR1B9Q9_POLSC
MTVLQCSQSEALIPTPSYKPEYKASQKLTNKLPSKTGGKNEIFSIIIDAGCWKTRVAVYGFVPSLTGNSLRPKSEFYRSVSPGLSAFAQRPYEGVHCLDPLLREVENYIPASKWHETPLVVMANSGLQRLPLMQIDNLLESARQYCTRSPFKVGNDSVTVLDSKDEGLLAWFSLNSLLGYLKFSQEKTAVSIDMGPDYMQVAFVPKTVGLPNYNSPLYYTDILAYFKTFHVYSRGFWGLGIFEARHRILQKEISPNALIFVSSCISPSIKTVWNYNNTQYSIRGSTDTKYVNIPRIKGSYRAPVIDTVKCLRVIQSVIAEFEKPPPSSKRQLYATGVFYDIVKKIGLIILKKGANVELRTILRYAKYKCRDVDFQNPFLCMDALYVYGLFKYLFDYPDGEHINIVRTVYGSTVDWTFGAAALNLQHKVLPRDKFNNRQLNAW